VFHGKPLPFIAGFSARVSTVTLNVDIIFIGQVSLQQSYFFSSLGSITGETFLAFQCDGFYPGFISIILAINATEQHTGNG
jgi:hypothetical protein